MFALPDIIAFFIKHWESIVSIAVLAVMAAAALWFARKKFVKTPVLSTMSPMVIGLLLVLAVFAIGSVLLPLVEQITPNMDRFLRFISIVVPIIITGIFSQHQFAHVYTLKERERVHELTAGPINSLLNVMRGLDNLRESWQVVCREHKISDSTQHAVTESFYNLTRGTAAAVNSIIMVTPGEKNAPGWHDFQQTIQCPNCDNELQPSIGPLRESVKITCTKCKSPVFIKRRSSDGGLTAAPWKDWLQFKPSRSSQHDPTPVPQQGTIQPPNTTIPCPKCALQLEIESPPNRRIVNRGCPRCDVTFRLDLQTKEIQILPDIAPFTLSSNNVEVGDDNVLRRIRCRCGNMIGAKSTKTFEGAIWWNCWKCGTVIKDRDGVLPSV